MAKRVKGLFVDAGFTLLEPTRPVAEIYRETALAMGIPLPRERFERVLRDLWAHQGSSLRRHAGQRSSEAIEREGWRRFTQAVAAAFPRLAARHEEWLQRLFRLFDDPDSWRLLPGVAETLPLLKENLEALAVVSNWHGALHRILEAHGMRPFFDRVVISSEVGWSKPHPAIFETALRELDLKPEETVHVGDSLTEDVEGALRAGVRPLLIPTRGGEPRGNGVETLSDFTQVPAWLAAG